MDSPIRILHVGDDPDMRELMAELLEREDDRFTVTTAGKPSKGRERLEAAEFDCIVSDFDMPGESGIAFLETARSDDPDLPFILFTGKGSEEVASDAISAGATDYLEKAIGSGFTTASENTGFGLAIVAQVAEAHGWDASVTDSRAGGARFEFTE